MSEAAIGRGENGAEPEGTEVALMDNRSVDETLRMIARMPAPEGLEERVKAGLHLAGTPGRVLAWPAARRAQSEGAGSMIGPGVSMPSVRAPGVRDRIGWVRTGCARGAAAAAIALAVAGGGWGIYSRVEPAQSAKAVAIPQAKPAGAFSEAGAMRRPLTLTGPVVKPASKPDLKKAPGVSPSDAAKTRIQGSATGVPAPAR